MALVDSASIYEMKAVLFEAANQRHGNMEPSAAGLIFRKHISNGFELTRQELLTEFPEGTEDPDEYLASHILRMPAVARWLYVQASAKQLPRLMSCRLRVPDLDQPGREAAA
ncbi:hypothetical protein [Paracoccus marcusii]|uniref:hypothetical protein n=1 Tax=Paracoccus marcusii TaxID=59779 RepID=UPI003263D111